MCKLNIKLTTAVLLCESRNIMRVVQINVRTKILQNMTLSVEFQQESYYKFLCLVAIFTFAVLAKNTSWDLGGTRILQRKMISQSCSVPISWIPEGIKQQTNTRMSHLNNIIIYRKI